MKQKKEAEQNSYTMAGLLLKNHGTVCLLCKNKFAERRIKNSS